MKTKRFILMLLVMLGSVTGAWAQQTFISAVKISAEEGGSTNKERLVNDGYTVIDQDLNAHEGGRDIYIGYKTTTNPAEAITGILIVESSSDVDVRNSYYKTHAITYCGKKYYRCDSYGSNDDNCDLNRKSGGADITLYYTKDGNTNHGGTPLTELTAVGEDKNKTGYSYVRHWKYDSDMYSTAENDVYGNTNEGNGSYKIYLPYKFHRHNVTATFNWATDGNTCNANMSCDCGMTSTNVPCTITTDYHPAPTCTTDGQKTCTAKVNKHGKDFVSDAKDFVASKLGHNMVHHAMVEATCVKDGHYEYWTCSRACCDASTYYKDAEGTESYSEYPVIPICPAPYIDADGSTKEVYIDGEITNSTTTLSTGWYIVLSENVQTGTIVCEGAVHLILADGAKLTATGVPEHAGVQVSDEGASLTIYGQQNQTGQLIATGGSSGAGIGGGDFCAGHDITINGGVITATGGNYGAGIGGGFSGSGHDITINGGVVTAVGTSAIGGGYNGGSSNILVNSSLVLYADGNNPPTTFIEHTNDTDVSGSLSGKQYAIARKLIQGITITLDKQGGTGGTEQVTANEHEDMPKIDVLPTFEGYHFQGYYAGENGTGIKYYNADGTSAHLWDHTKNTTLYANWKESVAYIDVDGAEKYIGVYDEITNSSTMLTTGWYIVSGANVQTGTLVCEGDVHIILADGAKLTATGDLKQAGVQVSDEGASLTIYGQENQTGQLIATGGFGGAGIGGGYSPDGHDITINGGVITATGGNYGAGIGGGNRGSGHDITINGGVVTATGNVGTSAIGGGFYGGSSNIRIKENMIIWADGNNPPTTVISYTSGEDVSSKLSGKQYAIVRAQALGITITFDKQGGTDGDNQVIVDEGSEMPTITVPTRDGYQFRGYFTSQGGSGVKYYNIDGTGTIPCTLQENTTLYAYWIPNCIVTLDQLGGSGGTSQITAIYDAPMPAITVPSKGQSIFQGYYTGQDGTGTKYYNADGTSAHVWDLIENTITLYACWNDPASYVDADGTTKYVSLYETITNAATTLTEGWYVVSGEDVQTSTLVCEGEVHLILADGAKLTAISNARDAGIRVSAAGASLTIYGQQEQSGQLIATGSYESAGIGGAEGAGHDITINGGTIKATGGFGGAGIGGGYGGNCNNVTINGGEITAVGGEAAAGIGGGCWGSCSNVTINGGSIIATSGAEDVTGIGGGRGYGSSKIFVNASLILKADGNNPPTTVIAHTTKQDVSSLLSGQRYASITLNPNHTSVSASVHYAEDMGARYGTYYNSAASYQIASNDETIYTASLGEVGGETALILHELEGDVIPAGTPVILKSDGNRDELQLDLYTESVADITIPANSLSGSDVSITAPDYCYILTYGQNGLGFYKYAAGKTLAAHKAYLTYEPGSAGAKALRMVFADDNEVDGIQQIENGELNIENSVIYNLNGMRLDKLQKGINIVNGKKVIIK